jgi:nucleoside triphosphatase
MNQRPTVGAIILNPNNEVLLVKSHKWKGKYVIPGGHIELGERVEDALRREVREETGLGIYDIEFVCFQEFVRDEAFWKQRHFIFLDFSCRTDAIVVNLNDEAEEYLWVDLNDAVNTGIEPYTKRTLLAFCEINRQRLGAARPAPQK